MYFIHVVGSNWERGGELDFIVVVIAFPVRRTVASLSLEEPVEPSVDSYRQVGDLGYTRLLLSAKAKAEPCAIVSSSRSTSCFVPHQEQIRV